MSVDADEGEFPDRWDEDVRRAAKDHRCHACGQTIERGHLYHRTAILFEGSWDITNRCARCDAMHTILQPRMGEDQYCAQALNCGHTWQDNFGEEPPLEVQALAFLTPSESQILLERVMSFGYARRVGMVQGPVERAETLLLRVLARMLTPREREVAA